MFKVIYLSTTGSEVAEELYEVNDIEQVKADVKKKMLYGELKITSKNGTIQTSFDLDYLAGYRIEEIKKAKVTTKPPYL